MGRIFRDLNGSIRIRQDVSGYTAGLLKRTQAGSLYPAATQYKRREPDKCLKRTRFWKNVTFLYGTAAERGQTGFSQMGQDADGMVDGILQENDKNETCIIF